MRRRCLHRTLADRGISFCRLTKAGRQADAGGTWSPYVGCGISPSGENTGSALPGKGLNPMDALIELNDVSKRYDNDGAFAVEDVSLRIASASSVHSARGRRGAPSTASMRARGDR